MHITNRRPSSTRLLTGAVLTLTLAAGGTAIATHLPNNIIESRHIKDGTVRSADLADNEVTGKDIDESTLGTVSHSETTAIADRAYYADQADTATRLLGFIRVRVSASGVLRPTDQDAVNAQQSSTPGRYVVTLGGVVLGCSLMAGISHNDSTPIAGSASAWITPFADNVAGRKVTVETHAAGSTDAVPDPLPFTLFVVC